MHPATEVAAPAGTVHGTRTDGVHVFRGIPYALPPIGALRFAPPVAAPPVEHIDATRFGAISLQDIDPLPEALPGTEHNFYALDSRADEDCLSLNIWTADPTGTAPVLVFIHGGGFLCGSGTGDWINGARLAREQGIVVVTINYRLGLLGNLWLGDVDPLVSNLAIQDDIEALRWVRDNIAAFGGDPASVTIGGESAGAMSVAALLCAPDARGLFRRAVVMSGHFGAFRSVDSARRATETILTDLKIDRDGAVLDQLRSISTLRLAAVQRKHGIGLGIFPLVMDDVIIDGDPLAALAAGCARGVDLLIGSNSEEDRLFSLTGWAAPTRPLEELVAALLPDAASRDLAVQLYSAVQSEHALDAKGIGHLVTTDHAWTEPLRSAALAHARSGGRTFVYELAWGSSIPEVGAAHLIDLPFFFGTLDQPGVASLLGPEVLTEPATIALGDTMSAGLARFVRTGDPADGALADGALAGWQPYTPEDRVTMVLDRTSHLERDRLAERLDFWSARGDSSKSPLASALGVAE